MPDQLPEVGLSSELIDLLACEADGEGCRNEDEAGSEVLAPRADVGYGPIRQGGPDPRCGSNPQQADGQEVHRRIAAILPISVAISTPKVDEIRVNNWAAKSSAAACSSAGNLQEAAEQSVVLS